jgi:pimeloyl-ACP methyl ester carboxylesterase
VRIDREGLKKTAGEAHQTVQQWFDTTVANVAALAMRPRVLGVTFVTDEDERTSPEDFLAARAAMPERIVVLIHGLDDPGWMWDEVAPALHGAGYVVARFEYPNDGPIADAADRFAMSLMRLKQMGVQRVDIVAHSMGGLVTRDVLTRDSYYGGDGTGGGRFPAVDRFIMCGTPNHGSELARLRGVSEVKEQITRVFSGEGTLLGGMTDGSGEAAEDLLPGSTFLRRLNARPLANHTKHSIIAGRMSPVAEDDVAAIGRAAKRAAASAKAPKWLRDFIESTEESANGLLNEAVRGLGDGCVSIDSARLEGVDDFVLIEANHISMIINITPGSDETAPAIPLILERLSD